MNSDKQDQPIEPTGNASAPDRIVGDSIAIGIVFALLMTVVQRLVGFGRGIMFCRMMPDDQLGQWSMIYSFLMLLAPLAVLGLPGTFGRYVEHYRQQGALGYFLAKITRICIATAVSVSVLMALFPEFFSWLIFRETHASSTIYMMASAMLSVAIFNYVTSLLEALCQVRLVSLMRFISGIGFAIFGLSLAVVWHNQVEGVILGFALGCGAGTLPGIVYLIKYRSSFRASNDATAKPLSPIWKKIIPFASWMWIINLVSNVYEVADRSMLLHLSRGTDQEVQSFVGQYHSGRVLPLMLVGVAVVLYGFLMPYMTAFWEKQQFEKARQQLRWTIKAVGVGFTGIGLMMLLASPFLFDVVLQGRYQDGLAVLPLTLVYCIWYSLVTVGQDYLWCAEKGKLAVLAVAFGLVVNIAFNFVLIPFYGLYGAVTATAISNLVCLVALFRFNQSQGFRMDLGTWLTILMPLVLLLPGWSSGYAMILLLIIIWRTEWIFSAEEKYELANFVGKGLARFSRRTERQVSA